MQQTAHNFYFRKPKPNFPLSSGIVVGGVDSIKSDNKLDFLSMYNEAFVAKNKK